MRSKNAAFGINAWLVVGLAVGPLAAQQPSSTGLFGIRSNNIANESSSAAAAQTNASKPANEQVPKRNSFSQFGADSKIRSNQPTRPSQKSSPESFRGMTEAPRFTPNAAGSAGRYTPSASASGPVTNPQNIVVEEVPLIPRRNAAPSPYQNPTPAPASQTLAAPNNFNNSSRQLPTTIPPQVDIGSTGMKGMAATPAELPATSAGSLRERLAAARKSAAAPAANPTRVAANPGMIISEAPRMVPGPANNAATPFSTSSRFNPKSVQNRNPQPQEIINPLVDAPADASAVLPNLGPNNSVLNSSHKVNNDAANAATTLGESNPNLTFGQETPSAVNEQSVTNGMTGPRASARRGFTQDTPVERTAGNEPHNSALSTANEVGSSAGSSASSPILFSRQTPQISVETTGPRTITVGKEATYVITIKNLGELAAQDVTVSVRVPDFAEILSGKTSSGSVETPQAAMPAKENAVETTAAPGEPMHWQLPRLEARGKETLTLRLVPRKSRPFELGVQWSISPVASQAMVEVQEPKLNMTLTGPEDILFGQTKIYKLTLSNPGSGDAENVTIHLSPLGDQSGAMTKHQIGALPAGESKVVEVEMTARQAGKITIKSQATADGGLQADVVQEVLVRRAGMNVAVTGSKSKYAGTVAAYTIQVSNPGNAAAESVQLSAQLPPGAKFVSATGGQHSPESGKVTWTIPAVRSGGEQTFELKCLLTAPGQNKLTVNVAAAGDLTANGAAATQVEALADLKLEVIEPKGPLPVGEDVLYEVRLKNRGSKSAEKIVLSGFFSEGIEPVAATGAAHELDAGMVQFQPIATLAPGSEVSLKIKARATQPGNLIFRAEAVCEADGTKLVQQSTQLFYGDDNVNAKEPRPVAGPEDDINAPAPLPSRSTLGSSRRQPAAAVNTPAAPPVVTPAISLPMNTPSPTGSTYVPLDVSPAANAPATNPPAANAPASLSLGK